MKKLFILAATAATISMSSCGNKTAENTAQEDSLNIDTVAVLDQTATLQNVAASLDEKLNSGDAEGVKAVVEQVQEQITDLLATGDTATANQYASKIQEFVNTNKEKLEQIATGSTSIDDIVNAVKALPTTATETGDAAVDAVKADASAAKDAAKAAATDAANQAKAAATDAANKAVEDAKAKANAKVDEAATKANDAANKAVSDAAAKAKSKLGL